LAAFFAIHLILRYFLRNPMFSPFPFILLK
jgi:hypothetical protein